MLRRIGFVHERLFRVRGVGFVDSFGNLGGKYVGFACSCGIVSPILNPGQERTNVRFGFGGGARLFFFLSLGGRMVSVLFLLRMLWPAPPTAPPNPPCGIALTVSVSTVIPPLEDDSFPSTVGLRANPFIGGADLCRDPVGVLSSLLYPSDSDSWVEGAIDEATEPARDSRPPNECSRDS